MAPRVEQDNDVAVVHPGRSLTAGNVDAFQRTVRDAMDDGQRRFLVDMGETEAVDSAGLGALVRLQRAAADAGGRLALMNLRENGQILLRLTQLDTVLEVFDSRNAADEGFAAPRPEAPRG